MKWNLNFFFEHSVASTYFFPAWSIEFLLSEEWDCDGLMLVVSSVGTGEADCDLSLVSREESALNRELELDFLSILPLTGLTTLVFGEGDLRKDPSSFLTVGWGLNIGLVKACLRRWRSDGSNSPWCWNLCEFRESWESLVVGPGDWREDWEEKLERRSLNGVLRLLRPTNKFNSNFLLYISTGQSSPDTFSIIRQFQFQ